MSKKEAVSRCLEIWNDQSKSEEDRKDDLREFLTIEEIKYKPRNVRSFLKILKNAGISEDVLSTISLLISI